jgi:hypothetical protein
MLLHIIQFDDSGRLFREFKFLVLNIFEFWLKLLRLPKCVFNFLIFENSLIHSDIFALKLIFVNVDEDHLVIF